MKVRIMMFAGMALLLVSAAGAQTKISGTVQCAKPDPNYSVEAGDKPGHVFTLTKGPCKWTSSTEINGEKISDDTGAGIGESSATMVTSRGTRVLTMANGDKIFASVSDKSPVKNGMPTGIEGTWMFTGATGKMKGIKGHGTYKVTPAADGTSSVTVEGEYTIPPPAPPKAATPKTKTPK